ncbi:MAG TPA: FHA domain-containing protein [Pirellulales bacterium]|jgi:adenylate cyclase|nr:FHA domain-containing protein [Pirellulales bacterium]
MLGELIPVGGGDDITLAKAELMIGRRESCDIVLRFPNVSAHHCQLNLIDGYWYVKDLGSRNGIKVNGTRYQEKRLDPGDKVSIAKHEYEIKYSPVELGAKGPPPAEDFNLPQQIFGKSLLERAGLAKTPIRSHEDEHKRFDVMNNAAGQIKDKNKPV